MRGFIQQTFRRQSAGGRGAVVQRSAYALFFRSAALFIILFQIRLIAGDLADTGVFTATMLAGFAAAGFLSILRPNGKPVNPVAALISIALIPWVGRALIAMPRYFIADRTDSQAIMLDSLLLNLDRNNFAALFPYYWSAVSTFFSVRPSHGSRKFLRAAIIADAALLLFIFSIASAVKIEIYRWPIIVIVLFAAVVFLQVLALLFSMPPQIKLRLKEICFAAAALLAIIITGGFLFLKPFQQRAVEMGGGLLEPKFFSFDLSQYLKLDPEISVKNDLVLIVKKEKDNNILLRRSVLSGYSRKQGFYRIEELDERTHPQRLPEHLTSFTPRDFQAARYSSQEYFLVNIDASAFIGMKEPVTIRPYESRDNSSFKSAYGVDSLVSGADYWDLTFSAGDSEIPTAEQLGLSESEYKIYTEYGNDERIRALAEDITNGVSRYADKVRVIYGFLKYGEYRYSLKPGIAPDGDQLGWFLFRSKKGYCSYYAFAMTLLLRSVGIPARVAAGFFIDPKTNTFDYYPVRSDMAHAWVEVAFPKYGWIEFDPTTDNLAEGEEFQFADGTDPALFEKLMREILENNHELRVRETGDEEPVPNFELIARGAIAFVRNYRNLILNVILIFLFICIRCGPFLSVFLTKSPRKKSIQLMKHAFRRLYLAGIRRGSDIGEAEWALKLEDKFRGIYSMYLRAAAARFAPEYPRNGFDAQRENYKLFRTSYNGCVPLMRRITAWLFPPLALTLKPCKKSGNAVLFILILGIIAGSQTNAQDNDEEDFYAADKLYAEAGDADHAELWDRAIELYREGSKLFPDDERFPHALGNLYYSRSLYSLAWDEYRKAEAIAPDNPDLLMILARTAGYMNRNSISVEYYERVLEIDPDNTEAIGNLGWMYFKVHRLSDGERLLVSALEQFADNTDFLMTLGTIYSEMYRYDESKSCYGRAIELSKIPENRLFTTIAWYNLSILEEKFYHFDLCMDALNSSLNTQNRAPGRIGRGELFLNQLELKKALDDFEAAYETDTSPLAKLTLAQIYQISGRLEEARLYAEDCLRGNDNSWMLFFGIDPDRYKRDIYQILADTYYGLVETEKLTPWPAPMGKIRSLFRIASYKLRYAVNIRLYRKYCLASANAYTREIFNGDTPHPNSYIQYFKAFENYPRRAFLYLNKAREFESSLIPAAIPGYDFIEGRLFGNEELLEKALYGFDPLWERKNIGECYMELANAKNSRRINSDRAAEELFVLNRGALRQAGIKLPVRINLIPGEAAGQRNLERALAGAGFKKVSPDFNARFTLNVKINKTHTGYTADCELADNTGETAAMRFQFPLRAAVRAEYYDLARNLGNAVFIAE